MKLEAIGGVLFVRDTDHAGKPFTFTVPTYIAKLRNDVADAEHHLALAEHSISCAQADLTAALMDRRNDYRAEREAVANALAARDAIADQIKDIKATMEEVQRRQTATDAARIARDAREALAATLEPFDLTRFSA